MRHIRWFHVFLLMLLVLALGVPPQSLRAFARRQQGPIKTSPQDQPAPPVPPSGQQQKQGPPHTDMPTTSISVQSNVVNIDVVVTDQEGNLLRNMKKENFRIIDNGQTQQISNFAPTDAPITIVMLMEFSRIYYGYFGAKAQYWAANFLDHLNQQDWVAFKRFDLRTTLEVDFTQNKQEVLSAIESLFIPDFSEANLFDAIYETLDQLRDVQGKKSILVMATGFDTLSRHNLDQTLKRLRETDVTIFCVGTGEELDLSGQGGIGYLQARNQLNSFATMTGGYAWFPRFTGEIPDIFNSVAAFLRTQYTLGFSPNTAQDGKFHKLVVQAVDDQGNELMLPDKKGKMKKVIVHARQGYTAAAAPAN